jgi:hypothetical protein
MSTIERHEELRRSAPESRSGFEGGFDLRETLVTVRYRGWRFSADDGDVGYRAA